MAGRGPDEPWGRLAPPGSRRSESSSVRFPGRAAREEKRHSGAPEGARAVSPRYAGAFTEVPRCYAAPEPALPPSGFARREKRRRRLRRRKKPESAERWLNVTKAR